MLVGYFSCLVMLGGSGIDSSMLEDMGKMRRLWNSLPCSYLLPESPTTLCWLLEYKADLLVMHSAVILELNYSSNVLSQEENTVISDQ